MNSDFKIISVLPDKIFLEDLNLGRMSVTNDADDVCERIARQHPGRRIIYKDSEGQWDEMIHAYGKFKSFKRYLGQLP